MNAPSPCSDCGKRSDSLVDGLCPECQSQRTIALPPISSDGSPKEPAIDKPLAGEFGDYELLEEVAQGGMGVVYKARHRKLNRIAALKMIRGGRFSSAEERQRFQIEAEAAGRLDHPGIVPIYELGQWEGQPFFAMKFIEGGSLADQISQFRDQPRSAMTMLAKVARAVHHAHQRGILHRDLKPANILIDADSQPLVTDLGLAKTAGGSELTHTGVVLGTPSYMSPEQASGNSGVTLAVDVYSLGAIMYELLTGAPPFRGSNAVETVMMVINDPIEPPHNRDAKVDRDLELICLRCLQRDPEARYASALELASDLEAWLRGDAISVTPPSLVSLARRWFRHNRRIVYGCFALVTGLMLTLPFVLVSLGSQSNAGSVYQNFPADQRPWLFSFGTVPLPVFAVAVAFLLFVLWPSIGFVNVMLIRPSNLLRALGAGVLTSAVLSLLLFVVMGWIVLLQGSVNATNHQVHVLAHAVWQADEAKQQRAVTAANELFDGLTDIPDSRRADIVADRISAEQFASATTSLSILGIAAVVFSIPVIYGTLFGYALIEQRQRFWLFLGRYLIAWWTTCAALNLLLIAFAGGTINGRPASDYRILLIFSAVICLTVTYFTLRRWSRRDAVQASATGS